MDTCLDQISFELQLIIHEYIIQFYFSHLPRVESERCAKSYLRLEFCLIGYGTLTTFLKGSNIVEKKNCRLLPGFSSRVDSGWAIICKHVAMATNGQQFNRHLKSSGNVALASSRYMVFLLICNIYLIQWIRSFLIPRHLELKLDSLYCSLNAPLTV